MELKFLTAALVASGGAILATLLGSTAAEAYFVTTNGRTGPYGQPLNDITIVDNSVGDTLDPTVFSLNAGTDTNTEDLVGEAVFTVLDFDPYSLSMQIDVTNSTNPEYQSAMMSLFFGVNPNITSATVSSTSGNVFQTVEYDNPDTRKDESPQVTGGMKGIDVCILSSNNCSGGNINNGLQSGQSDSFILTLYSSSGGFVDENGRASVTISDVSVKWQTQDGSYTVSGVPEPMTILGSGMALGMGAVFKRRMAKQQEKGKAKEKVNV